MKAQRIAIALTAVNLVILIIALVMVVRPEVSPDVASVLRGRSLEIVDAHGDVRAQIIVAPPSTVNGESYPETVLFRLINPDGMPGVKIDASENGAGLLLSRKSQDQTWNGVQILTESSGSVVRLRNEDGREQVIQP